MADYVFVDMPLEPLEMLQATLPRVFSCIAIKSPKDLSLISNVLSVTLPVVWSVANSCTNLGLAFFLPDMCALHDLHDSPLVCGSHVINNIAALSVHTSSQCKHGKCYELCMVR